MSNEDFERLPPNDLQAEMCVLGSAMLEADAAITVVDELTAVDFLRPAHQVVFDAIAALVNRAETVNPVSVRVELDKYRDNGHVPAATYLFELIQVVPTSSNVRYYIDLLRRTSALRRLAEAGPRITGLGYRTSPDDAADAIERAQQILDEATRQDTKTTVPALPELLAPFLDDLEAGDDTSGVTTGLADLDELLKRLRPGQLITVGARPGCGKSIFMAGLAHHVGLTLGQPVYVSTLEMSAAEYTARLISRDGKINLTRLLERSLLTEEDWKQLSASYNRLTAAEHLYVDDQPLNGIGQIRAQLRSMRRNGHPAALAVVDYLQLMRSSGRAANRQEEVSELSRSLKLLAKEEGVPIVVGSQLNRGPEQRSDKRPMVSDLRESGSVEQDSDVVILLHREDLYDPETSRAGEVDMIVGKNRNGPTGTVTAAFQGHYSRIMDMAPEPWSPYKGAA